MADAETLASRWQQAPCGHLVSDDSGVVTDVNETLLAWTGYDRASLVGSRLSELLDPGSRFFYETRQVPVLRLQGEVREVSLSLRRPDGTVFPALLNAKVAENGEVHTSIFDATERNSYERELLLARRAAEASERSVRVLQGASLAFGAATSFAQLGNAVVDSVREAFSAAAVAVMMPGVDGVLRVIAGAHPVGTIIEGTLPSGVAFAESRVVPIRSLDEARDFHPDLAAGMKELRFEALLAVPLHDTTRRLAGQPADTAPLGTVTSFYSRARDFDDDAIELQRALIRQAAQAFESIRLIAELEQLALRDPLTGLANRSLLAEILDRGLAAAARDSSHLAVLFLDLDGFKLVNDTLGHAAGDALLLEVAERLSGAVRQNDVIGRFGGDEFVVVCELADEDAATAIAERIRAAIARPFAATSLPVSASIGVALHAPVEPSSTSTDEVLTAADNAMYRAKAAGKNQVVVARV